MARFNNTPQMTGSQNTLNASAPDGSLNSYINMYNEAIRKNSKGGVVAGKSGRLNPQYFYTMQLLETIRLDADEYVFFRYADSMPIENKGNKLTVRRWTPLRAHTTPLVEGIPPVSDRASAETYEVPTNQYGRFMEFTDKVDFKLVDPVVVNYSKEYSVVAIETLDLLARAALDLVAQPYFAGFEATSIENLTAKHKPSLNDLRRIVLDMKKLLVKPRQDNTYHVIAGPEFYYDMVTDELVEKFMKFNQDTYTMYKNSRLVPMFEMSFYETLSAPASGIFFDENGVKKVRVTAIATKSGETDKIVYGNAEFTTSVAGSPGYYTDSRTGIETSYDPKRFELKIGNNIVTINTTNANDYTWVDIDGNEVVIGADDWALEANSVKEFKVAKVFVLGKDALIRTGIKGQDQAQMYVKDLGSAGVNDPLNQRQSIGFKINSVGFGNARAEAVSCYYCVPTSLNV